MKKTISKSMAWILSVAMMFGVFVICSISNIKVNAASDVVERAIDWAIGTANDNSHGYSQQNRWGPDYDCSSFVITAFKNAGVDTGSATYTGNMRSQFTQNGFEWIPWSQIGGVGNLQRGDILLNEVSHTEIYLGNNQNVGAHSNRGYPQTGDQTGTEVSVSGYYYHPWDGVLRYTYSNGCTCSESYAGEYEVTTSSLPLTIRSGHGSGYSSLGTMPKGAHVYVSKSDGSWAHVEYEGIYGYASMQYLTKINVNPKPSGYQISAESSSIYSCEYIKITISPYQDNVTEYCYYIVTPNGNVISKSSSSNKVKFQPDSTGTWKIYAKISNQYGSFSGSESNGCVSVRVSDPNMGGRQDLGSDFYAYISNKSSGNVLTNDGDNVSAKTKQYTNNQKWHFIRQSDGSYQIQSVWDKGKYLDAYSRKGRSGDNLQVYGSEGESPQQWNLYTAGSNVYYIMPSYSKSAVIDIADGSTASGANVQIWAYNQTAAQKFEIQKIGSPEVKVSTHSISLDLCGTNSATISVIADGIFSVPCKLSCSRDTTVMSTSWGEKTGNIASLNVSGIKAGAYSISVLIINSDTGDTISSDNISVNIICSHKYSDWSITKSPTCTVDGYKTRKCSVCGNTETQSLKALGHSYTTLTVKPTCTSQGYTVHTCSRCSSSYTDNYTSVTGHSFGSWTTTKQPTCTADGTKQRKCSDCGKTETQTIPATGHSYKTTVKEPTYTEQGYTLHTCSKCGYSYKDNYTDVLVNPLVNQSTISKNSTSVGGSIIVTAKASGGSGGYKYAVSYKKSSDSSWSEVSGYSTTSSVTVKMPSAGTYTIRVNVKDSKGKIKNKDFTVAVNAALANTSKVSSTGITKGKTVTVTCASTGGTGNYTYAVYYRKSSSTSWTKAQDYSTNSKVKIKPAKAVKYAVLVKVKDSSGKIAEKTFTVNVFDALKNNSTVSSENIGLGDTVTIKAKATGGVGSYSYAVYYKKASAENWTTLQKYSDNTTVSFKPASAVKYDVMVKIKDSRGIIVKKTLTVNVTKPENTSKLSADTVKLGNTVTVSCSAKGGSGYYQYAVLYKKTSSEKWTTKQNYSSNTTVSIKPAAKATYDICVKVKDSLGNIAKKYFTLTVTK